MKLSEMRECLAREGIRLTRSLGQNFLHDANQLRRIVEAAELTHADRVLEIGPGLGPLTELLLERAGEVLAIEKDQRLADYLKKRFGGGSSERRSATGDQVRKRGTLRLLCADALEFLRQGQRDWSEWKLVSNLPYSSASPMLVELAQGEGRPSRMVVTLQREVAKRIVARAGATDYGVLTLLIQSDFEPGGWFKIPAGCFFPQPDVDSACICLSRRARPLLTTALRPQFVRVVKRAFSQRRKMMSKLLKSDWPENAVQEAFEKLGLDPKLRAEDLALEDYVRLTEQLGGGAVAAEVTRRSEI
jgi:16S rRNA (adenine1518-N6/adenine1519-N6)-dimethyltransferase